MVVVGGGGGLGPLWSRPMCVVRCWMALIVMCLFEFRTSWSPGVPRSSSLSVLGHVDEILPDVSPVGSARAAAMPMSLPTVAEVMSSAVLAGEVAPVGAPLAEVETVIVGMISLMEAGSELPVESLESERVTQDCLSVDVGVVVPELSSVVSARAAAVSMSLPAIVEVVSSAVFARGAGGGGVVAGAAAVRVAPLALDVVGLDVAELSRMDSDDELPPTVAEPIVVNGFAQPDVVPVVMVNVQTDVIGDDRFSPGVE